MYNFKKERVLSHDAIKTLSIFLVCIYHYNFLKIDITPDKSFEVYLNYFFIGISSMGVPLFFMVNGSLLLNKPYNFRSYLEKVSTIIILFIIWDFISLTGFIVLNNHSEYLRTFIKDLFYLKADVSNHLWFLQTLISIYLLYPIIKEIYDSTKREIIYWLSFIIFFFSFGNLFLNTLINVIEFFLKVNYFNQEEFLFFPIINPFGNYYYSLFYFIIGGLLSKENFSYLSKIPSWHVIFAFLISLLLLFLYGVIMTVSDRKFYDTVWYGYHSVMTLVMSVSVFSLFYRLKYRNKAVNYCLVTIGSSTLGIYFVHRFFGWLLSPFFKNHFFSNNMIMNLLFGVMIIVSSLLFVLALKKIPIIKKLVSV